MGGEREEREGGEVEVEREGEVEKERRNVRFSKDDMVDFESIVDEFAVSFIDQLEPSAASPKFSQLPKQPVSVVCVCVCLGLCYRAWGCCRLRGRLERG